MRVKLHFLRPILLFLVCKMSASVITCASFSLCNVGNAYGVCMPYTCVEGDELEYIKIVEYSRRHAASY